MTVNGKSTTFTDDSTARLLGAGRWLALVVCLLLASRPARAWTLDEPGQRNAPVTVVADATGRAVVQLAPDSRTLWYVVELQ